MRRRTAAFVLSVLFVSAPVQAELKLFPMWERVQCGSEQFACYDFQKAQEILKIDLDLQLKLERLDSVTKSLEDMQAAYGKLKEANTTLSTMNSNLETRLKEKQVVLEANTLALAKAEGQSVWNNLPWIIVAVVVVGAGAFVGGYYLGSR